MFQDITYLSPVRPETLAELFARFVFLAKHSVAQWCHPEFFFLEICITFVADFCQFSLHVASRGNVTPTETLSHDLSL